MLENMPLLVVLCLVFVKLPHTFSTSVELLELDTKQCLRSNTSSPIYLSEHEYFEVVWNGSRLLSDCKLVFKGDYYDRTEGDDYKVCVKSHDYSITDCRFHMEIRQIYNLLIQEKSCGSTRLEEICTDWGKPLILSFVNTNLNGNNSFSLSIGATKDKLPDRVIGVIVGVTLGVVVLIAVVVLVVVCVVMRKRHRRRCPQTSGTNIEPTPMTNRYPGKNGVTYDTPYQTGEPVGKSMETKLTPSIYPDLSQAGTENPGNSAPP